MKLMVNEIFYSLQGEGGRSGEASIFIRLSKCNLTCDFCDTEFESGEDLELDQIYDIIKIYPGKWIIWTGGEPTLQLRDQHLAYFSERGYKHAIETNGTRRVPSLIDYITCSPKQYVERVKDKIPFAHEIRLAAKDGDVIPEISLLPKAANYFLSPIFDDEFINEKNVAYCVNYIKTHPEWRLSLQMHKLIQIP